MQRNRRGEFLDPQWKKHSEDFLERMGRQCQSCEKCGLEVSAVHIAFYSKDKALWEFSDEHFVALCDDCSSRRKMLEEDIRSKWGALTNEELDALADALEVAVQVNNNRSALFHNLRDSANDKKLEEEL